MNSCQVGARTDVWDLNGHTTPLHAAATAETNAAKMVGLIFTQPLAYRYNIFNAKMYCATYKYTQKIAYDNAYPHPQTSKFPTRWSCY